MSYALRGEIVRPIVHGVDAKIEDFPFQVLLAYGGQHICGGSIIGLEWVLTAAHCVSGKSLLKLRVRVGSSFRDEGGYIHKISQAIIHSNYEAVGYDNDIALLKVQKPFKIGPKVRPIALINRSRPTLAMIHPGVTVIVTGWGDKTEGGKMATQLQKTGIEVVSHEYCEWVFGKNVITSYMFCAGGGISDSCHGDSGGPVVFQGHQIGIVSWGDGCARPGYPAVYVNVYKYWKWIRRNTRI